MTQSTTSVDAKLAHEGEIRQAMGESLTANTAQMQQAKARFGPRPEAQTPYDAPSVDARQPVDGRSAL